MVLLPKNFGHGFGRRLRVEGEDAHGLRARLVGAAADRHLGDVNAMFAKDGKQALQMIKVDIS